MIIEVESSEIKKLYFFLPQSKFLFNLSEETDNVTAAAVGVNPPTDPAAP